ncbi:23260_t:CDS:1, partial [Gigaspora margarita]
TFWNITFGGGLGFQPPVQTAAPPVFGSGFATKMSKPSGLFGATAASPFGGSGFAGCQHCSNRDQNNYSSAPDYIFYNVILEGELDLNDFVNLNVLCIEGIGQDQQQKLTSLKIDNCINLTQIAINHTTLGCLSFGCKPSLQSIDFIGNKRLIFCDNVLKNQVERLSNLILTKDVSINDLKIEIKKIKEENLKYQLDITKSNLDEDNQLWLDSLLEAQHEVLHGNSTYAHKQLEKCKNRLSKVLTDEEIQDFLGNTVEINEMETQLNKLTLKKE